MTMPPLQLSLQWSRFDALAEHRAALPRAWVARCLRRALGADVQAAEIGVRIVGLDEARQLNRDHRGKDYATNVLTFDYSHAPHVAADMVLCGPVVAREATAAGTPLADHYAHLLVHGTLHAQGWDHESSDADAEAMEAEETAILARLGVPDPYRQDA